MKEGIHPDYQPTTLRCACGAPGKVWAVFPAALPPGAIPRPNIRISIFYQKSVQIHCQNFSDRTV